MRGRSSLSAVMSRAVSAMALCLIATSCSGGDGAAGGPPVAPQGDVPRSALPNVQTPQRSYEDACAVCHDNGGFGVRVLADRLGPEKSLIHKSNDLDPDTIRAVVRGGMGAMPAMSKLEVSDAELDEIIAHLGKARTSAAGSGQ